MLQAEGLDLPDGTHCPVCRAVRVSAYKIVWPASTVAPPSPCCPPPAPAGDTALRGKLAIALAALQAINYWDGECLDHPSAIGSPNPREIAGTALDALAALGA